MNEWPASPNITDAVGFLGVASGKPQLPEPLKLKARFLIDVVCQFASEDGFNEPNCFTVLGDVLAAVLDCAWDEGADRQDAGDLRAADCRAYFHMAAALRNFFWNHTMRGESVQVHSATARAICGNLVEAKKLLDNVEWRPDSAREDPHLRNRDCAHQALARVEQSVRPAFRDCVQMLLQGLTDDTVRHTRSLRNMCGCTRDGGLWSVDWESSSLDIEEFATTKLEKVVELSAPMEQASQLTKEAM